MSFFEELKRRNVIRIAIAYGITAWFILQLSDVVLDNIESPDWVMQVIMLVLVIGFPVALIFAWAFEMTPEGLKREKDVDRSQSITTVTGRKLDRVIIGILVMAVGYLLIDKMVLQEPDLQPESAVASAPKPIEDEAGKADAADSGPSVAVLPFVNMSGDAENEYFSDGLTETLLHMLAQLPELRVAARTSSFSFKGSDAGIEEIAKTLKVAHILEGSVQKAGNRVRITAQLIRADDGFHIWSQNYDRTLEDIFAIQDEIAADVAGTLDKTLLNSADRIGHVETSNLDAYDTYLRALEQQAIGSYGSLATAENLFKQALGVDPDFIDAKLSLVRNYLMQFNTGMVTEPQMQQAVRPMLEQVREVHPENILARALEVSIRLHPDAMMSQETLQREVNSLLPLLPMLPSETYLRGNAALAVAYGTDDSGKALKILQDGLMVDPLSSELYAAMGTVYRRVKQYESARESYLKALELDPLDPNHYSRMSTISAELGDVVGVFEWRLKNVEADPQDHEVASQMARLFYEWGLPEEGDRWLARVEALAPNSDIMQRLQINQAYAQGDLDRLVAVAKEMIAAPASMRHDAFPTALFSYANTMSQAGRQEEAHAFLTGVRPEIQDYHRLPQDIQGVLMQSVSIELMSGFATPEKRKAAWLVHAERLRENGPWWLEDPAPQAMDALFQGDLDKAIEKTLEDLARPLTTFPLRPESWASPTWAPITSDPAVAARLTELKNEKQEIRKQIIVMLQGPEWGG